MTSITDLLGFELRPPDHQNSLDIFGPSWVSRFPATSGLRGGEAPHFDDVRVVWAASALGGLQGKTILELGPLEGYNTYQFQSAGAGSVLSIEASRANFLKCLVVKNIFGLNASFLHGDFQSYLESTRASFDICWASGVLYHLAEPVALLVGIRRVATSTFIWTQYFDEDVLRRSGNYDRFFDASRDRTIPFGGRTVCLHYRRYDEQAGLQFSGGQESYSYWMSKEDIMFVLASLGFDEIIMGVDNPEHPPGPAMFFIARVSG